MEICNRKLLIKNILEKKEQSINNVDNPSNFNQVEPNEEINGITPNNNPIDLNASNVVFQPRPTQGSAYEIWDELDAYTK